MATATLLLLQLIKRMESKVKRIRKVNSKCQYELISDIHFNFSQWSDEGNKSVDAKQVKWRKLKLVNIRFPVSNRQRRLRRLRHLFIGMLTCVGGIFDLLFMYRRVLWALLPGCCVLIGWALVRIYLLRGASSGRYLVFSSYAWIPDLRQGPFVWCGWRDK